MAAWALYDRIVSSSGPDLFVICKKCGSEVSQYVTECPYCGTRLRKRAPKLDRDGRMTETAARPRRRSSDSLGRLRRGEIPGIRHDRRPYGTMTIVALSLLGSVILALTLIALPDLLPAGGFESGWWRFLAEPLIYSNTGYTIIAVMPIAVFGWLLERRHGLLPVLLLFLLGGVGGAVLASVVRADSLALGGNSVALALLVAWVIPDVRDARRGIEVEGDLLGVAAFAVVLLLVPIAVPDADPVAGLTGVLAGLAIGLPLARLRPT